jgi:hypothetical protein
VSIMRISEAGLKYFGIERLLVQDCGRCLAVVQGYSDAS